MQVVNTRKVLIAPPPPVPRPSQASLLPSPSVVWACFLFPLALETRPFGAPSVMPGSSVDLPAPGGREAVSPVFLDSTPSAVGAEARGHERRRRPSAQSLPPGSPALRFLGSCRLLYFLTSSVNYYFFNFKFHPPFASFHQDHEYLLLRDEF